jgi:DNA-binding transcriptional ArsR family regulator
MTDLDLIFQALANPTRRDILARLMAGEANVMDLAAPFNLTQPTISTHLKVLEQAGLVTRSRSGNARPVKLAPDALRHADQWFGDYRRFWDEALIRLEAEAKTLQKKENPNV